MRGEAVSLTKAQVRALKMIERRDWPAGEPSIEWVSKSTAAVLVRRGLVSTRPGPIRWGRQEHIADLTPAGRAALQETPDAR